MAKLDICTGMVRLNRYTTVYRGPTKPLNYVEVELIRATVGEDAVSDLEVIETVETTNQEVLENLRLRYGSKQVGEAFPGTRPRLPMQAPEDVPRTYGSILEEAPRGKPRATKAKAEPAEIDE